MLAICLLVVAVLLVSFLTAGPFLTISVPGKRRPLLQIPVSPGYEFATWIIHSVQLTPVVEYFTVGADGLIYATGADFQDLGWGLPSTVSGTTEVSGGKIRIRDLSVSLDEIPFRVSHINEPKLVLITDGISIRLSSIACDGDSLRIRVERRPSYTRLFGGVKNAEFAYPLQ
jgi:hypothetical protein